MEGVAHTGEVSVEVPVVGEKLAIVHEIRRLDLLLVGARCREMRVEFLACLQDRILGRAMLERGLERSLRMARAQWIVHEALPPSRVILPRVQLPVFAQPGTLGARLGVLNFVKYSHLIFFKCW